ncbi:GTP 3',8-cyclase MoaA [Anaeromyxobacter oryzae]|uniref:GTP 3',8-cyclase n=1 Tax=Anaeromyxobacter oryzae TaxID=2918170 RepID=A0ABM7WYJ7_9BACT|nr:GTP 3',8-cyclase MoaA [Anaeromyxobacter oryzae]BDG04494.1 GTP 3',8-cyclase [Anaeromyxobacter oryzae]
MEPLRELAAPASRSTPAATLADAQGRLIRYLRISLTDRCNFRCTYCSPAEHEAPDGLLSRAELAHLVRLFAGLGVRRIRLTGGEPTLRKDVVEIVADAAATPGIEDVAITTNGHRLDELVAPLARAGLGALNVSLDTLVPDRLHGVSGKAARLERILAGIDAAAGRFRSLKLNTVVMRGVNEDELGALVRYAWDRGALPRFIEQMPFGGGTPVPLAEVRRRLEAEGFALSPDPWRGWGPARHMRARDGDGREGLVGFIGAMTENFCEDCNRARVAADGGFQACLGGQDRVNLRDLLRAGADDAEIAASVRGALAAKAPRHHMDEAGARLVLLPMRGIGG